MTRDRDELDLLLPFHANGTLTPEERAEVEAWLAEDDDARAEAETLAAIRRDLQAEEIQSPGEFGLARLMRDVDRNAAPGSPVAAPQAANILHRPWVWQAVAAVALAAFVGQGILTWNRGTEPTYQLAGADAGRPEASLVVTFVPEATEIEIRTLLVGLGAEIVSGPSSLGLYRIGAEDPAEALAALRAATGLVESAEQATD